MGCDKDAARPEVSETISIHAPAWGATFSFEKPFRPVVISIHAPAWGATMKRRMIDYIRMSNFNPRTRMGCDPPAYERGWPAIYFNPRTRMGCDSIPIALALKDFLFQSTHPHGVRQSAYTLASKSNGFQSTHPHGVRPVSLFSCRPKWRISIHAPAWGATLSGSRSRICFWISIHAPAWGATPQAHTWCKSELNFNPRTRMGCDTTPESGFSITPVFQSTHPHGVRHGMVIKMFFAQSISIHAPAWGATLWGDLP